MLGQGVFAFGPRGISDTNVLVLATQKYCIGRITQREDPMRVCIAVEYRL